VERSAGLGLIAFTVAMSIGSLCAAVRLIRGEDALLVLLLQVIAYGALGCLALAWWLDRHRVLERAEQALRRLVLQRRRRA
jgi:hypothetical protein